MAITINEVENGMGLLLDGQLYFVVEFNHVKPGKGSAFVRIRLKNIKTDAVLERTFRSAETLDDAPLERRRMQFTYVAGDEYHFMDQNSFEDTATIVIESYFYNIYLLYWENCEYVAMLFQTVV